MIPAFRPDGTLPPGTHSATLDEVFTVYLPRNQQRQILNDSLRQAVIALRALDPAIMIYVDGGYITSKAEPNDVDLLIITNRFSTLAIVTYLDQVCPVEAVSLDINVEQGIPNVVFDVFTTTRRGQDKGIILLT